MQSAYQPLFRWAWVLFFFSGLTGLIYEILWTRRLTLIFGHSILAVSTVVTAYMGGLALGSLWGGRLADQQVMGRQAGGWFVRAYGALEFFVGLWGLLSLPLLGLVEKLYFHLSSRGVEPHFLGLLVFGLSLVTLLPPTLAMGATLPVVGCLFSHTREGVGQKLSRLYALNTWGAVGGAGLAGFVLLPWLGLRRSIVLAACINGAIAVFAWRLGGRHTANPEVGPEEQGPEPSPEGAQARLWLPLVFGLSGFASMIFQIGWTRGLALCLGGAVYSFSAILVVFLAGIALGSLIYPRLFSHRKVGWQHLGLLCLGLAITGAISMVLIGFLPLVFSQALPYVRNDYTHVIFLNLAICGLVLLPPTLLMGLSFPLVTHLYHNFRGQLGRSIGNIYGANTLGCILGSFGAGFVGLPLLGVQTSLQVAVSCNLVGAVVCARGSAAEYSRKLASAALVLLAVNWFLPRWSTGLTSAGVAVYERYTWDSLMRRPDPPFYQDGLTCSVALDFTGPDQPSLRVNGKVDASLGQADRVNMNLTGYIPLMYVERPRRVGIIGLGSGMTVSALAGSPRVESVLCAELESAVIECQKYWAPYVDFVHQNPKVKLIEADGRTFVLGSVEKFDIIVSEPSNPWIAGIGNLYTQDFFRQCREKLNQEGLYLQWCHLYALSPEDLNMVLRSFFGAFPHGEIWLGGGDLMLLGSPAPMVCKPERLREYWEKHPSMKMELADLGFLRPEEVMGQFVCNWDYARGEVGAGLVNSDDRPILEYSAPRSLYRASLQKNLEFVMKLRNSARQLPSGIADSPDNRRDLLMGNFACIFRDVVEVPPDPKIPPPYAQLFELYQQATGQQPVPPAVEGFLQKYPDFVRARLEWARRALEVNQSERVLALLGDHLTAFSRPEEQYLALLLVTRAQLSLQSWSGAIPLLDRLFALRHTSRIASDLADCHGFLKDYKQSRLWAERALQLNPYDFRAMFNLAQSHMQEGQWPEAERLLKQCTTLYPPDSQAWIQLARLYLATNNQVAQARWAMDQAIRLAPTRERSEELKLVKQKAGL